MPIPQFVELRGCPLQRVLVGSSSLVERLQLPNQFFNTFQVRLQQHPPGHLRHLDAQLQQGQVDRCGCDGRPRIEEGAVGAVEVVEVHPGLLADTLALRMAVECLEESSDVAVGDVEQPVDFEPQSKQNLIFHFYDFPAHVFVLRRVDHLHLDGHALPLERLSLPRTTLNTWSNTADTSNDFRSVYYDLHARKVAPIATSRKS